MVNLALKDLWNLLPCTRQILKGCIYNDELFDQVYQQGIEFAPIGLMDMYNSGGAVESVEMITDSSSSSCRIQMKGRGEGRFGAYSSRKPNSCSVNSKNEEFKFNDEDNLLTLTIPSTTNCWDIVVSFWGLCLTVWCCSIYVFRIWSIVDT